MRDDDAPEYPEPTDDEPSEEELTDMTLGFIYARATDGCEPIEPDGECEHGYPAWPLWKGVV